jgi:hypothetical protein
MRITCKVDVVIPHYLLITVSSASTVLVSAAVSQYAYGFSEAACPSLYDIREMTVFARFHNSTPRDKEEMNFQI